MTALYEFTPDVGLRRFSEVREWHVVPGSSRMTLIGIDCATDPRKLGLARGRLVGDRVVVDAVCLGSETNSLVERLTTWIDGPTLLAIDAPLGWPVPLRSALAEHRAGAAIVTSSHEMFRRHTDRVVKDHLGKTPLDVGADRIARTAHRALSLLGELRERTGLPIPLAWTPDIRGVAAIEVYPAATLAQRAWNSRGYKSDPRTSPGVRRDLIERLRSEAALEIDTTRIVACDDLFDAVLCVVAGADFLRGRCVSPSEAERERAENEGWIWFSRGSLARNARK